MSIIRTEYKCSNPECNATDLDRGTYGPGPKVLNCWKCGNGRGCKDVGEMKMRGQGMFPVAHIDASTGERMLVQ